MTISYGLYENNLTSDPGDYRAIVQYAGTIDLDGVIAEMIERGSTTTKADTLAVLQDYHAAIELLTLKGFKVITPGANYGVSIKGVFNSQADSFDPSRHRLEPTVSPGARYRQAIRTQGQSQKQETTKPIPNLLEYIDINSGERNSLLTPGGMGQLTGHRLKFDPADPNQGVFFMATDSSSTRADVVGKNTPAELMFLVPTGLVTGDYTLVVRAVFGQNDLRIGILDASLSVV